MLSFVKFFSRVNALKMHDSMNAILLTYVNSYIACPKICQQCLRSKRSVLFFFLICVVVYLVVNLNSLLNIYLRAF